MLRKLVIITLLALFIGSTPSIAMAKCGTGNPPSYDDIWAVMIRRDQGFWSAYKGYRAKTFGDSAFWAALSNGEPSTYVQYDLDYQIGTYKLKATLDEAVAILRRGNFFAVSSSNVLITDVPSEFIFVERCRIVTRVQIYDSDGEDHQLLKLFDALASLVENSAKIKLSPRPKAPDNLMVNP